MKKNIRTFLDNSVLQAALTLIVWGTICYLYIAAREVPDTLLAAGSIILGFYFRTAAEQALTLKRKV